MRLLVHAEKVGTIEGTEAEGGSFRVDRQALVLGAGEGFALAFFGGGEEVVRKIRVGT